MSALSSIVALAVGCIACVCVACARLIFLAPTSCGWVLYLSNVLFEVFVKRLGVSRHLAESGAAGIGLGALWLGGLPVAGILVVALVLVVLELYVRAWERAMLTDAYAELDTIGIHPPPARTTLGLAQGYPAPSTHPVLSLNLSGPFHARWPRYRLGSLLVGLPFEIVLMVGNHSLFPTQTKVRVHCEGDASVRVDAQETRELPVLHTGDVQRVLWRCWADRVGGAGTLTIEVIWGHFRRRIRVHYDGCIDPSHVTPVRAGVRRYPGGARSAFVWRGDMDLYDTSTRQSVEGLEVALGLAARYRVPQTMFLSSRLALDKTAARDWAVHYGVERGASEIPRFVAWFHEKVELRHICAYPFTSAKPYLMELGNHGHLHYGTDTSGAPENGWQPKARMGAGNYPWLSADRSSFAEQRDNALQAKQCFVNAFGFEPRSWAKPNRTNDEHTAAAMEAAGCEVLSGSDVRPRDNVLLHPPPHHPHQTATVELTTRYPGDPQHAFHVAMLLFWVHRSHRLGIPMIYMCHQHLRQFDGAACTRFTEYLLRYIIDRMNGDLHMNTVFGVGKYWREVLSPKTRRVRVSLEGKTVRVVNSSDLDLVDLPVDIQTQEGHRLTVLVSAAAGEQVSWPIQHARQSPKSRPN